MELRQLTAVVAIADTGSVTRAAGTLQLVQPAVTRQLRTLEAELGTALFERTRSGMVVTEAGAAFVNYARRALAELEQARSELSSTMGSISGSVSVGLLDSLSAAVAAPLVTAVRERHPGVRLQLLTGYSGHLQEWLDRGSVEIALLYDVTASSTLHLRPLWEESLWAVAPPGEWPSPDRAVPLTELARRPVVMPAPPHGLRTLIDTTCTDAGVVLEIAAEANTMQTQKQLVQAGIGWSILPRIGIETDVQENRLSGAPLTGPEMRRSVVLARGRRRRTSAAVLVVARELERVLVDRRGRIGND